MTKGDRVRITIGDDVVEGRLWDNPTARDLATLLPLTLEFRDLNDVEKVAQLSRALTTDGVPRGDDAAPGVIGYYAPSRDLVLYYGNVGYWDGIVRIGELEGDPDVLRAQTGPFSATVELA
jgi:hypothetical protein